MEQLNRFGPRSRCTKACGQGRTPTPTPPPWLPRSEARGSLPRSPQGVLLPAPSRPFAAPRPAPASHTCLAGSPPLGPRDTVPQLRSPRTVSRAHLRNPVPARGGGKARPALRHTRPSPATHQPPPAAPAELRRPEPRPRARPTPAPPTPSNHAHPQATP